MRPRAEPGLGSVVPHQGVGPQQIGEGASQDTPIQCLQKQPSHPSMAPAREKQPRAQLRLQGPLLREPDPQTTTTRRQPNPCPHPHHPNQPITTTTTELH